MKHIRTSTLAICGAATLIACAVLLHGDAEMVSERVPLHINKRAYDSIRHGMTVDEVQHLLGAPPGDHGRRVEYVDFWGGSLASSGSRCPALHWRGEEGKITVWVGSDGKVRGKQYYSAISVCLDGNP